MTPQAQNPIHPQNVRHRRPTNSRGSTKFTNSVPLGREKRECWTENPAVTENWNLDKVANFRPISMLPSH